jgi:hypothetical protein
MVDIQPTATTQPISDDQELAKVLAGVNQQADDALQFEETPAPAATPAIEPVTDPISDPIADPAAAIAVPPADTFAPVVADDLTPIKNEAINELRPLVDKLNLQPEEKFDTYLLLLRSTDDRTLIAPAHAAAQSITDEARKAQALLDIIKEIDYLSNPQQ